MNWHCLIRMCDALLLKVLSEEINGILNPKHSMLYHQYDLDFKFHTLLFLDQDYEKIRKAYMKVQDTRLSETLVVKRFADCISPTGKLGTFKIDKVIDGADC